MRYLEPANPVDVQFERDLRFFDTKEVRSELKALQKHLPKCGGTPSDLEDEDDLRELVHDLGATGGPDPAGSDTLKAWALCIDSKKVAFLQMRIQQALKTLAYAEKLSGKDFSSTRTVALPARWDERVEMLLGFACVPVSWVVSLDITKF